MKYRHLCFLAVAAMTSLHAGRGFPHHHWWEGGPKHHREEGPPTQPYAPPTPPTPTPTPWFTGPLIAPVGTIIPYGDFEIESYIYATTDTGAYNANWNDVSAANNFVSVNPQFICFFGITSWADINIIPQFYWQWTDHQTAWEFGDLQVGLDLQLLDAAATPYFPGIKLTIRETFPTGNWQNLNPKKQLTDLSGAGTFATTFDLVLYKQYQLSGIHYMSTTYSFAYTVATPTHVSGISAYGGAANTNGRVMPGNSYQAIISFEFGLSQNWAFAIDNVYTHVDHARFTGTAGSTDGVPATVGLPSSEQLSFCPAIEYNFSSTLGIIGGCWFTAVGRNSAVFRSGVVNVCYTY